MKVQIKNAIRKLRKVKIDYPPGTRTIEPHALGDSSEGNLLLRAYQTEGASASGEHEHWKLLRVDRIRSLAVLEDTFPGPRPGYKKNDKAMKGGIDEEL
jgi:predicted DNA-binding transcriptional regulator YafY